MLVELTQADLEHIYCSLVYNRPWDDSGPDYWDINDAIVRKIHTALIYPNDPTNLTNPGAADPVESAFRAGYHCNWSSITQRYTFDPGLCPGDPDGAWAAYQRYKAPTLDQVDQEPLPLSAEDLMRDTYPAYNPPIPFDQPTDADVDRPIEWWPE